MNYKKLIIVLLILYILYNCFKVREGLGLINITSKNHSRKGEVLRKNICENINIGVDTINIQSFDYDNALKCNKKSRNKQNFRYKSVDSNSKKIIQECSPGDEDKDTYFPEIDNLKDKSPSNDTKFNDEEIKTIMNCHIFNNKFDKSQYVNDIYGEGKFSKKYTIDK